MARGQGRQGLGLRKQLAAAGLDTRHSECQESGTTGSHTCRECHYWVSLWQNADDTSEAHSGILEIRDWTTKEPGSSSAAWVQVAGLMVRDDVVRSVEFDSSRRHHWMAPDNTSWAHGSKVFFLTALMT